MSQKVPTTYTSNLVRKEIVSLEIGHEHFCNQHKFRICYVHRDLYQDNFFTFFKWSFCTFRHLNFGQMEYNINPLEVKQSSIIETDSLSSQLREDVARV